MTSQWVHDTVDQVGRAVVSGLSVGAPPAIVSSSTGPSTDASGISVRKGELFVYSSVAPGHVLTLQCLNLVRNVVCCVVLCYVLLRRFDMDR